MKTLSCILVLTLIFSVLSGQDKKISIESDAEIMWAGVDRPGDLFLVLKSGEIQKFNKAGKKVGGHSFKTTPSLVDPMDGVQSFYYFRDENQYGSLSADLGTATSRALDPAFAISPWLLCPSLHELWILDSGDFSIKKTKMRTMGISFEVTLKQKPSTHAKDYLCMKEYQNYLFLLDKSEGIHVFNSLGVYLRTLGQNDLTYFGFLGEEIYFMKGSELILVDLYSNETRSVPLQVPCRFALLTDEKIYAVDANRVTILDFKPGVK